MAIRGARLLKNFLRPLGCHLDKTANPEEVRRTLSLLHPRSIKGGLMRIGGEGDGGYLVPHVLDGIGACFSPGVSTVADFEIMLRERHGIPSFLADASVDGPPEGAEDFDFEKRFLGARNDAVFTRLSDWIARKEMDTPLGDLMLQIDIERAEYSVITDTPQDVLDRFRLIVIELHMLDSLFSRSTLMIMAPILEKLTANHIPVHVHPNNCAPPVKMGGIAIPPVIEVTLVRSDHFVATDAPLEIPHPLDRTNVPSRQDFDLPKDLYFARG